MNHFESCELSYHVSKFIKKGIPEKLYKIHPQTDNFMYCFDWFKQIKYLYAREDSNSTLYNL